MKALRQMTATALLAGVLAIPAVAGEMHAGFAPPPPPSPTKAASTDETEETGDVIFDTIAILLEGLLIVL